MTTSLSKHYFTFGSGQVHSVNGKTFDKDCVVLIEATSPGEARKQMFEVFGPDWSFQYDNTPPDMSFFPRGIMTLGGADDSNHNN